MTPASTTNSAVAIGYVLPEPKPPPISIFLETPCALKSGGCERRATDQLVAYINSAEGLHYEHRACLDRIDNTQPQPECLYENVDDARRMVIERKSIAWPPQHAYEHSKDHDLANAIVGALVDVRFEDPWIVWMPPLTTRSRSALTVMGNEVALAIRALRGTLQLGQRGWVQSWNHRFEFGILPLEDRSEFTPSRGLGFSWKIDFQLVDPVGLRANLRSQLDKLFAACIRKFANYADARRILMLDPYGDANLQSVHWWIETFVEIPVPRQIDEVWIASQDVDDDGEEDWILQKVFGGELIYPLAGQL